MIFWKSREDDGGLKQLSPLTLRQPQVMTSTIINSVIYNQPIIRKKLYNFRAGGILVESKIEANFCMKQAKSFR